MKLLIACMLLMGLSCTTTRKTSKEAGIVGKWKMTKILADIGDGKATWQDADKDNLRTITFGKDGAYADSQNPTKMTYKFTDSTHFNLITTASNEAFVMTIMEMDAKNLVIRANCREACGERFVRVDQ